ncbi:PepSY domain-containing protein [Halomicronema sp. CCY15110]|uniref:PepSY domain-containing protein n=1 Tax=Halomicronema sp. CCY15110 TaxID=2767773 RepID=UPI0019500149|nr:PepSY domain-containing protein [Halomicronema sp. CCY15110]
MNRLQVRQLHRWLAPIMMMPLLLTLTTGMLFQTAISLGKGSDFVWLLALHRGKFGSINLELVYPFFNGLGLLALVVTGIFMWWQGPRSRRRAARL